MRESCEVLLLASSLQSQITFAQVASKGAKLFERGSNHCRVAAEIGFEPNALGLALVGADRSPRADVASESPCRNHCSKSSAIFNERWFDAGGLCLGLADPACSAAQSRLTTQIAVNAGIAVDLLIYLPVKKVITPDSEEGAVNLLTIY